MQQGTGHSNDLPARDLGPIKARLRRWYLEIPDLYATAEYGISYICREVGKWAPPLLSPGTFWNAKIPYCGLVFEILYGWLDGQRYVLFSQVIRLLPTDPFSLIGSSVQIAIRSSQIGPFHDLGLVVFVPRHRILNYAANNGLGRSAELHAVISGSVNVNCIRPEGWSGQANMLVRVARPSGQTSDAVLTLGGPVEENSNSATISKGRIWRLFLPQHVPRRRPDIVIFKQQPSQWSLQMENHNASFPIRISLNLATFFTDDRLNAADTQGTFALISGRSAAGRGRPTASRGNNDIVIDDAEAALNGGGMMNARSTRSAPLNIGTAITGTWLH